MRPEPARDRGVVATLAVVAAVSLALALWRGVIIGAGPDADSDAYGHHLIARKLLDTPWDHGIHWVWLPGFHWFSALVILLGGGLDAVRWLGSLAWTATPVLLAWFLVERPPRGAGAPPDVAAAAGLLLAICPIGMQMGTTAQTEPWFALALLAYAVAMQRQDRLLATTALAFAVLTRYEGWAVVVASAAAVAGRAALRRASRNQTLADAAVLVLPTALIFGWAWARLPYDGRWFGMLAETRRFANQALGETSSLDRGLTGLLSDALYYPWSVPSKVLGVGMWFAPLGVLALARRAPWLALTGAAVLGFITLGWLTRGSLGLDRHIVAALPVLAACIALGVEEAARLAVCGARALGRTRQPAPPAGEGGVTRTVLRLVAAGVLLAVLSSTLIVWMEHWTHAVRHGFPSERRVAQALRAAAGDSLVFSEDAATEVLSGLPRRRFLRGPPDARRLAQRALAAGASAVYHVGRQAQLEALTPDAVDVIATEGVGAVGLRRLDRPALESLAAQ